MQTYAEYIHGVTNNRFQRPFQFFMLKNGKKPNNFFEKLSKIELQLEQNPLDLFLLEKYIILSHNKININSEMYYSRYISLEPNNPYILMHYARYLASSMYKKDRSQKHLLVSALKYGHKGISLLEGLHSTNEIPTFIYNRIAWVYIELGFHTTAIIYFDKAIYLNKQFHNHEQSEPFIWKANALNKMGKFKESNSLYFNIIEKIKAGKINDKIDFRDYKVVADNYLNIGKANLFGKMLKKSVSLYLVKQSFHFHDGLILSLSQCELNFHDIRIKNMYKSFLDYNSKYINTDIDKIIMSVSFLYLQSLTLGIINFFDNRGLESLCYKYLQMIYEGKIE